jgi:hypothetical protein
MNIIVRTYSLVLVVVCEDHTISNQYMLVLFPFYSKIITFVERALWIYFSRKSIISYFTLFLMTERTGVELFFV